MSPVLISRCRGPSPSSLVACLTFSRNGSIRQEEVEPHMSTSKAFGYFFALVVAVLLIGQAASAVGGLLGVAVIIGALYVGFRLARGYWPHEN